jgi:CheY-like chemotaxis protein
MRVLIADDDEVTLSALGGMLRHLGHEAVVTRNGDDAWAIINSEDSPALAILDWMMPGVQGPEICRRLRSDQKRPYQYLILAHCKRPDA